MFQAELGRWFAVDSKADAPHNFSFSPYNYVINNPLLLINPDGKDWFYHEKSGDIYYSKSLGKDAKFKDDGWKWLGQNDMFKNEKTLYSGNGNRIARKYGNLAGAGTDRETWDRAIFVGKNAKKLMDGEGYAQVPSQMTVHTVSQLWKPTAGKISFTGDTEKTYIEKVGYFKKKNLYLEVASNKNDVMRNIE